MKRIAKSSFLFVLIISVLYLVCIIPYYVGQCTIILRDEETTINQTSYQGVTNCRRACATAETFIDEKFAEANTVWYNPFYLRLIQYDANLQLYKVRLCPMDRGLFGGIEYVCIVAKDGSVVEFYWVTFSYWSNDTI